MLKMGNDVRLKADAVHPHGRRPRGLVSSMAKLALIAVDWWTWALRNERDLVLFDRYHGDLLVDPLRYRYGGPLWLAKVWQSCLPKPNAVIYLAAPTEILLSRKQEVSPEQLEKSASGYRELIRKHAVGLEVDATRPLSEVVDDVWRIIESRLPTA